MMLFLAILTAGAGPWDFTIPVGGLNDGNAAAFADRVTAHLATLKDSAGKPVRARVTTRGKLATITLDCPVAVIGFEDVAAALKGSAYQLDIRKWFVHGDASFRWFSASKLSADAVEKLKRGFADIGAGCERVDVETVEHKERFEHRLRLGFGANGRAPAHKVVLLLAGLGHADASLVWLSERGRTCAIRFESD